MSERHTHDMVSDETLASLSAEGRRVVRGMARGGWDSGSPATPAVHRTIEHLGAGGYFWNSEQVAGERRAFYPEGSGADAFWAGLAERLDALPRRKPTPKAKKATKGPVDPCEVEHPKHGCADVGCTHNCEEWAAKTQPEEAPDVGTAWLVPSTGEVWRLTGYLSDWNNGNPRRVPSYSVLTVDGYQSSPGHLATVPADAKEIWTP